MEGITIPSVDKDFESKHSESCLDQRFLKNTETLGTGTTRSLI